MYFHIPDFQTRVADPGLDREDRNSLCVCVCSRMTRVSFPHLPQPRQPRKQRTPIKCDTLADLFVLFFFFKGFSFSLTPERSAGMRVRHGCSSVSNLSLTR